MENSTKEIDDIIRGKLVDYQEDTTPDFWSRLNKRLSGTGIKKGVLILLILLAGVVFWIMVPEQNMTYGDEKITSTMDIAEVEVNSSREEKTSIIVGGGNITEPGSHNKPYDKIVAFDLASEVQSGSNKENKTGILTKTNTETLAEELPEKPANEIITDKILKQVVDREENIVNPLISFPLTGTELFDAGKQNCLAGGQENKNNQFHEGIGSLSRYSISLELGTGYLWRSMSSEPQFEGFKKYRKDNEDLTSNLSYEIKFNYQYKNWIISTGLQYSTIEEKLNYNIHKTIIDPDGGYFNMDTIWAIFYDPDDNLVPMIIGYDRTWIDEYKEVDYNVSSTNIFNYIEIPFSVGYKFSMKKLSLCPSVGASIGLLYSANGKLPLPDSSEFVGLDNKSGFLETSVTNLNFSLGMEYSITPNYGLYIKPFYKYGLNTIYKNYPLSVKYRNVGVKFGINIYL